MAKENPQLGLRSNLHLLVVFIVVDGVCGSVLVQSCEQVMGCRRRSNFTGEHDVFGIHLLAVQVSVGAVIRAERGTTQRNAGK